MKVSTLVLLASVTSLTACTTITTREHWSPSAEGASPLRDDCRTLKMEQRPGNTSTLLAGSPSAVLLRMQGVELAVCGFTNARKVVRATGPFLPLIVLGHVPFGQNVPAINLGVQLRGLPGGAQTLRISDLQLTTESQGTSKPVVAPASSWALCGASSNGPGVSSFEMTPGAFLTLCFPFKPEEAPQDVVTLRFEYEVVGVALKGVVALRLDRAQGHYFTWSDL